MKRTVLIAAILLGSLGAGVAMADDDECYVPMANWQPREAVQKMAEGRGWTVRRIKTEDGCYGIKGRDENGREIDVKVNPGSLAIVDTKHKDDEDDDDGRRGTGRSAAPAGTVAPPNNGLFGKGQVPKVEVK